MKRDNRNDFYKTACLLSIALHIFFVTGAEAALILSKKMNPQPVFISWSAVSALESKPISQPLKSEQKLTVPKPAIPLVESERRSNVSKPIDSPSIKKFKKEQNQLNQRIRSIKKEIMKKQVQLLQSVSSSVYDMDKIPVEMRTSVLPDYLKQMRSQISAHWLLLLDSVKCQSCTAIAEYRINSNGKIFDLKLLHSSQNQRFDRACMKAVAQSSPLPALPFQFNQEIKTEYLTVSLTFYYETDKPKIA